MEIAVARALFAIGALVLIDRYRLGAGWADDGPQSGYFPFYIRLLLCISSRASRCWRRCGSPNGSAGTASAAREDVPPIHETYSTRVHAVEIPVLHLNPRFGALH
jgi:hypothetical protein